MRCKQQPERTKQRVWKRLALFGFSHCRWLCALLWCHTTRALVSAPSRCGSAPIRCEPHFAVMGDSNDETVSLTPGKTKVEVQSTVGDVHVATRRLKCSVFMAVTLDGKIATSSGDVSFLDAYTEPPSLLEPPSEGEDMDMGFTRLLQSVNVIVMGRNTFDKVVSFGLEQWAYGSTPIVVWSVHRTDVHVPASLPNVLSSNLSPLTLVQDLERQGFTHAYVDGGYTVQCFMQERLIDSLILTTVPLILGEGTSLFRDSVISCDDSVPSQRSPMHLQHVTTRTFPNGLVQTEYKVLCES